MKGDLNNDGRNKHSSKQGSKYSRFSRTRDKLNLKLGAYNEAVKNNKIAAKEIKETLQQVTEEHIQILNEFGIDVEELLNVDIEALTTDAEYLAKKQQTLNDAYIKIDENVRKQLGLD